MGKNIKFFDEKIQLCDYIYKDATIFMERKYNYYKELCKISGN